MNTIEKFADKRYPVVLIDPPWKYYGDPNKDQAAGKHYNCMTEQEIAKLPINDVLEYPNSILFMWTTSAMLDSAMTIIYEWGLTYRGIAFHWIKTNKEGRVINGQGVRPSLIKYSGELVLWASFIKKGRPLPVKNEGVASYVLAPRPNNVHSRKPDEVQDRIELLVDGPYLEIFARRRRKGWDCFGDQIED